MIPHARSVLPHLFRPTRTVTSTETSDESTEPTIYRRSRVRVAESTLSSGDLSVQGRNTVDRFTGGSLDGSLFDEAPFWPDNSERPNWRLRLSLDLDDDPEHQNPYEIWAVLQAFKDLWLGDLPVGGEIGVGRGVMRGVRAGKASLPKKSLLVLEAGQGGENAVIVRHGDWNEWNSIGAFPKPKAEPGEGRHGNN